MESQMRKPIHLWIVGIVSALWNAVGASDYVMTQIRNPAWMSQMTAEQIAWFDQASPIAFASWAFGVWGALLGSILLLFASRHAVTAFTLSIVGLAVNTIYQMMVPMPSGHMDKTTMLLFHALIWAIGIGLLIYSMSMRRRGILR